MIVVTGEKISENNTRFYQEVIVALVDEHKQQHALIKFESFSSDHWEEYKRSKQAISLNLTGKWYRVEESNLLNVLKSYGLDLKAKAPATH